MSDQEASVSVSSTKRCPPSRCMYQYRRRSTSAQEASVSSTKRCPPSRCISTAVVTCRSTTKHMLGRRYHSPGRTYITCWAVIPFTAAESIGHTACGKIRSVNTPDCFQQSRNVGVGSVPTTWTRTEDCLVAMVRSLSFVSSNKKTKIPKRLNSTQLNSKTIQLRHGSLHRKKFTRPAEESRRR